MDDDIMLNIVSNSKSKKSKPLSNFTNEASNNKISKAEAKKLKYTMKMKMRSKSHSNRK